MIINKSKQNTRIKSATKKSKTKYINKEEIIEKNYNLDPKTNDFISNFFKILSGNSISGLTYVDQSRYK